MPDRGALSAGAYGARPLPLPLRLEEALMQTCCRSIDVVDPTTTRGLNSATVLIESDDWQRI
jgi:hypothetical protein